MPYLLDTNVWIHYLKQPGTDDNQWAAQLADHLFATNKDDIAAKQIKADALIKLAQGSVTATARNFYLTVARELREDTTPKWLVRILKPISRHALASGSPKKPWANAQWLIVRGTFHDDNRRDRSQRQAWFRNRQSHCRDCR